MRPRFDSVDFVQAVWTSFFARREELGRFTRPEEREVHLETSSPQHEAALAARQPTPSEAVAAEDFWECLLEGQPSHYRRVLNLRREGLSYDEIAEQLGMSSKRVQRVVERLVSTRLPWATPN
jgi:RNA polymerase sigma-70 factor (ECF subfamily)